MTGPYVAGGRVMRRQPRHIVFLQNSQEDPIWGGLEKLMFEWFERIDYRQCQVTLVIPGGWKKLFESKLQERNIPVAVIELPFKLERGLSAERFLKLFFFIRKLNVSSIIFMQSWLFSFGLAHVLAGFCCAPGKAYMHENLGPMLPPQKIEGRYFGLIPKFGMWRRFRIWQAAGRAYLSRRILVVSKEIKEKLISLWHYPSEKILIKYHGVDLNQYSPSLEVRVHMRNRLKILPEETVIFIAARLTKFKCVDRAIEAFDIVAGRFPALKLLIAGSGPLEGELKALAQNTPSKAKIIFLGHVADTADYFKMSDIYVLSSDNEGFGIALLEAMATGLICVATKCPGPNEIIENGINGFLIDKSVEGVTEGLTKALELSVEKSKEISEKSVKFVRENFEVNRRVRDVFDALGIAYSTQKINP